MESKELRAEVLYQGTVHMARKMLSDGTITADEYKQLETVFTEKYHPLIGVLFSSLSLDLPEQQSDDLEAEKKRLEEELNVVAELTQNIIAENARVMQDQDEYRERYDALVARYDAAKEKLDDVTDQIRAKEAQSARLAEFIKTLKTQDGVLTEFDERMWGSLVDYVTVGRKKEMMVKFRDGTEIAV